MGEADEKKIDLENYNIEEAVKNLNELYELKPLIYCNDDEDVKHTLSLMFINKYFFDIENAGMDEVNKLLDISKIGILTDETRVHAGEGAIMIMAVKIREKGAESPTCIIYLDRLVDIVLDQDYPDEVRERAGIGVASTCFELCSKDERQHQEKGIETLIKIIESSKTPSSVRNHAIIVLKPVAEKVEVKLFNDFKEKYKEFVKRKKPDQKTDGKGTRKQRT